MALFDHFQVGFIAEMEVSFLEVPRIKRMEANVVKAFFGYRAIWVISQNAIEIIVVTPRKQHVVQPAIPLIDPVLFAVDRIFVIRIGLEAVGEDDVVFLEGASDGEVVADDGPLRLPE